MKVGGVLTTSEEKMFPSVLKVANFKLKLKLLEQV